MYHYPNHDIEIEDFKGRKFEWKLNNADPRNPSDHLDIDMPAECFASEPWEFEKTWVNWLNRYKASDQCEFRRRRLFAYTIQPFIFLGNMIGRVLWTILLLVFGIRGISFGPLIHPFTMSIADIGSRIDGSWLVARWLGDPDESPLPIIFVPVPLVSIIASIIGFSIHGPWGLLWGVYLILGFGVVVLLALGLAWVIMHFHSIQKWNTQWDLYWKKVENRKLARRLEWERKQREFLACSSNTKITKISDLPKKNRTVYLRFQGIKSLVCKPFAK